MNEILRLADQLRRAYDGDPWHGSPLTRLLTGVSATDAAARPLPGAHSILETVLHIAAWMGETRERLRGSPPGEPAEGDWPVAEVTSESGWALAKSKLALAHEELVRAVEAFPEEKLWQTVGAPQRDRAAGTGTSYYVLLHGVVQHNVYHAAQIATFHRILAPR